MDNFQSGQYFIIIKSENVSSYKYIVQNGRSEPRIVSEPGGKSFLIPGGIFT